jgi:hypothetical protein
MGKKWPTNFAIIWQVPHQMEGSLTCHKPATWDRRLYFPSEERHAEDFFALKNPTAMAGFEPMILGTKGQHILTHEHLRIGVRDKLVIPKKRKITTERVLKALHKNRAERNTSHIQ